LTYDLTIVDKPYRFTLDFLHLKTNKNKLKIVLPWDKYSDQPYVIKDRQLKKKIYKKVRFDFLKMLLVNVLVWPFAVMAYFLPAKKKAVDSRQFFGLGVNLGETKLKEIQLMVEDLGCEYLIIRIPLHDIERLDDYVAFIAGFSDKKLLINILQDRRHVEDHSLLIDSLHKIFTACSPYTHDFQVGHAVNRKKWAFFSMDEYLQFYQVAYKLKTQHYPKIQLMGSSVIDFEYYFTIRTLFNFYKLKYDRFNSLLYVDRRGAPENQQMGLDVIAKIKLLHAILRLSPKSSTDIVITETNWPITNTFPYAPTSEKECVSVEEYAKYLLRYYMLAYASQQVSQVYWHQLIAPGYGLVDNREGLVKYPAYQVFKCMVSILSGSEFISFNVENHNMYTVYFENKTQNIAVCWALQEQKIDTTGKKVLSKEGDLLDSGVLLLGDSPVYLIDNKKKYEVS